MASLTCIEIQIIKEAMIDALFERFEECEVSRM
jgi:hypothetical protein